MTVQQQGQKGDPSVAGITGPPHAIDAFLLLWSKARNALRPREREGSWFAMASSSIRNVASSEAAKSSMTEVSRRWPILGHLKMPTSVIFWLVRDFETRNWPSEVVRILLHMHLLIHSNNMNIVWTAPFIPWHGRLLDLALHLWTQLSCGSRQRPPPSLRWRSLYMGCRHEVSSAPLAPW